MNYFENRLSEVCWEHPYQINNGLYLTPLPMWTKVETDLFSSRWEACVLTLTCLILHLAKSHKVDGGRK